MHASVRSSKQCLTPCFFRQRVASIWTFRHPILPILLRSAEAHIGRNMSELLPLELAAQMAVLFEQVAESGETRLLEYPIDLRGVTRFFEARIVPCGPDRVLRIVRDITERKRKRTQPAR